MARREYRDKTGSLIGYSETTTDRVGYLGPIGSIVFISVIFGFPLLGPIALVGGAALIGLYLLIKRLL